jgi:hypothetical protein
MLATVAWQVLAGIRPSACRRTRLYSHHLVWFAAWIGFLVEPYPFGLLTMIVSLEAIFLSTFVMISVNLADRKRQVLADHQWQTVKQEEQQNEGLLLQPDRGAHQGHPRRAQASRTV